MTDSVRGHHSRTTVLTVQCGTDIRPTPQSSRAELIRAGVGSFLLLVFVFLLLSFTLINDFIRDMHTSAVACTARMSASNAEIWHLGLLSESIAHTVKKASVMLLTIVTEPCTTISELIEATLHHRHRPCSCINIGTLW